MTCKKVSLKDIAHIRNGFAFKSSEYVYKGVRVIRITNVQKGQIVDSNPQFISKEHLQEFKDYQLFSGDILISLTGNVGRVGVLAKELEPAVLNQRVACIRIKKKEEVHSRFLFHYLNSGLFENECIKSSNGIAQLNLSSKWVENYKVLLPSLNEQEKIANILDQADALRQKRKQSLQLLDDFLRATFLDMFGDPMHNENGWEVDSLTNIAEIVSGVTKGRKLNPKEIVTVPYMRVANVQDGYIDLSEVKEIDVLPADVKKYRLIKDDVLLTEGGDPDKLGRGAVWNHDLPDCIHQNHIFRVRIKSQAKIKPLFLSWLIGSEYGKRYFLRAAKQTTGIATINSTQLKNFPVQIPLIDLQVKFISIVNQVEQLKQRVKGSLSEMDNQFNALTQRYFG